MLNKFIAYIFRYHKLFVAISVIATAIFSFWLVKIKIGATSEGTFPSKGDPEYKYFQKTVDTFGNDYFEAIAVKSSGSVFSYPVLGKIKRLTSEFEQLPGVDRVDSLTNAILITSRHDEISLKDISGDIPSSEAELKKFHDDVTSNPLYERNLVSPDEHATILYVVVDVNAPFEVRLKTVEQIRKIALAASGPEEIYITGEVEFDSLYYKMTWRDISMFLPLTLILIAVVIYANFRRSWCVLLSVLFVSMAIQWTFSTMAMIHVSATLLTATIMPVIAVVGVSNAVHFFTEYFRWRSKKEGPRRAVEKTLQDVLLPIWLKLTTTAIGFVSIAPVNIEAIKRVGTFLTIGVIAVLLLTTFFLPSAIILFSPKADARRAVSKTQ